MGGMPMRPDFAMKLMLDELFDLAFRLKCFELEVEPARRTLPHLPWHDGFTPPRFRRSRGKQAHPKRHRNRLHTSRRTRKKHRRAA